MINKSTKTPLTDIKTPNYHKNITLHNLQETIQNKIQSQPCTSPFPITINYKKLCHVLLSTIDDTMSSS
jgi:hypothetical protein